jgi:mycothiol synthase
VPATSTDSPRHAPSGRRSITGQPSLAVRFDRRGDRTEAEIEGTATGPLDAAATAVAAEIAALAAAQADHGASLHLAAEHPADRIDPLPAAVAAAVGLRDRRELLQLRRPLPVPADHPSRATAPALTTRPFEPGPDDAAWIRVNNRAFASHPDQGRETAATLAHRTAEAWFDPAGFVVADDDARPGELAGFCWTKVHPATADEEALGEIYVIGVDPTRHGEGLGPALVLAGLDHLAGRGIGTANLYVEADNGPARRLYDRLGFGVHRRREVLS